MKQAEKRNAMKAATKKVAFTVDDFAGKVERSLRDYGPYDDINEASSWYDNAVDEALGTLSAQEGYDLIEDVVGIDRVFELCMDDIYHSIDDKIDLRDHVYTEDEPYA